MKEKNITNAAKTRNAAVWKVLAAGFGWGIIGVFSRPLSGAGLDAVQITFTRSLIVAVGMAVFLLLTDKSQFRIHWKDIWMFLGSGLLSIVFFNICYFLTIDKATLAAASILLYTAPCFVLLMSAVLFHEKITGQKIAALFLAFAGCVLVSGFSGGQMGVGAVLTGIGSGVGYALYSIFGSIALKKYKPLTVIFYTFLIASVGIIPFSHVQEIPALLHGRPMAWISMLALGIVSTFLPFLLYTDGLRELEAGKASVLAFAEPMVATIAGIVIFREVLHVQNALGILLIFLAILLLNLPAPHRPRLPRHYQA
ncbi:MAG: EamA family transporter [Eubacteriales bacterium]|nr:EamA family transporter [Eubacteriales bacterium]